MLEAAKLLVIMAAGESDINGWRQQHVAAVPGQHSTACRTQSTYNKHDS